MKNSQNIKQKVLKGAVWRFSERVSSQAVGFIVSIILARLLTPDQYGLIALTLIFIAIGNSIVISGLGTSLIQKKDADELDFSTMFYAGLIFSILIYIIIFIASPLIGRLFNNNQICIVLRVMGLSLPLSSVNSIQQAIVSRSLEFKKFFYATLIGTFSSGILGISLAYAGWGVWALVGQHLSSIAINTLALNRIIVWHPELKFSLSRLKSLYSFGLRVMIANLIGTIFYELKSFIVGIIYTPADLAFLNQGEKFPSLVAKNVENTISTVLFPALSIVQDDRLRFKQYMSRSMRTCSFIMFPLMFILAISADKIVLLLLTEKWMSCVPFVRIFCLNNCVSILSTANLQTFNALGRSDITLKIEFYKKPLFLGIILTAMFISPIAIAVGTLVYNVIAGIINALPNKKLINYSFSEQIYDIVPSFLLSCLMAVLLIPFDFLSLNRFMILFLQISFGLVFYMVGAKFFIKEEYIYVCNILKNK